MFILYDIWWYGWLWLGFIAIAFCAARFGGCVGMLGGALLLAIILFWLDADWISDDMQNHPENGRDMDFVFMFGVALRVVVFNLLLLPVSLLGWRLFRHRRIKSDDVPQN